MKRKQLIKLTRDIPEDDIRRHLEVDGRRVSDYFLVCENGDYIRGIWTADGKPQLWLYFSEDEASDFAIEQFLLQNVPIYRNKGEIPACKPETELSPSSL